MIYSPYVHAVPIAATCMWWHVDGTSNLCFFVGDTDEGVSGRRTHRVVSPANVFLLQCLLVLILYEF